MIAAPSKEICPIEEITRDYLGVEVENHLKRKNVILLCWLPFTQGNVNFLPDRMESRKSRYPARTALLSIFEETIWVYQPVWIRLRVFEDTFQMCVLSR